ncbi:MAG TPA: cardiolipin synthase [Gammaproteobacteria bacterium]
MGAYLQIALLILHINVALLAIGHALLHKRTSQAALGWIATCILFPIVGPVLYFFFGINRVFSRAKKMWEESLPAQIPAADPQKALQLQQQNIALPLEFSELAAFFNAVTNNALLPDNHIEALHNGEQAYPAMLAAIRQARHCVYLSTYIFRGDRSGTEFIDALVAAQARGVEVKVLIDGYGDLYYFPRASVQLRERGINIKHFLPFMLMPLSAYINLRTHRKILTVDGSIAFTGGMNIGDHHLAAHTFNKRRVIDIHFRLTGPIVAQLEAVFLRDWAFITRQPVAPTRITHAPAGAAICRAVTDGPNEDVDKITLSLVSAVSAAHHSVSIMTPYFLPPRELIGVLQAAALRGIDVNVILPAKNNLFYVHFATRSMLWELLQHGVKVYYQPPPFVHSKLFLIDDRYAQIGSANLDPRSLRLNFEIMVEIYDAKFTQQMAAHFNAVKQQSMPITLADVDNRPLMTRLIDASFWLFSPYM